MSSKARAQIQRGGDSPKFALEEVDIPQPGEHELLVKNSYVAQNPTDSTLHPAETATWRASSSQHLVQSLDSNAFEDGTVLGCDFAGKIERVGKNVSRHKKGDTIAALIWGGEVKGHGAYNEYTLANEYISFKVPKSISPEAAVTVPLASCTAWLALFSKDCLAIDRKSGKQTSVLIWGASSSVVLYAIQIARLHNFSVVTICSPGHHEHVKSLGADHVFDYKSDEVVDQIKSAAPRLQYIFDTIGDKIVLCNGITRTRRGGRYTLHSFLKDHQYKEFNWPANEYDYKLSAELFENLPQWLEDGAIRPNELKVLKGLEKAPEGFQEYRDGKISGYKIVYAI